MRIALADDGALFRDGLAMLLGALGHEVVHSVGDGDRLCDVLADDPVDLAVLDIRMPPEPEGGLITAGRLRAAQPGTGLLLLSHYAETHYLARVLEIGPERIGYRLKDGIASVDALNSTITRIAAGEIVIDPALTSRLVEHARSRHGEVGSLSAQELRVLRLMAAGLSNSGIGGELTISRKAVEKHIGSVFTKLALPSAGPLHNRRVLAVLRYLDGPDRQQPTH